MRAALIVLVLAAAPSHVTFAVLGLAVSLLVVGLILAGEAAAAAVAGWLAVRALRRFRSAPWPRPVFPAGSMP